MSLAETLKAHGLAKKKVNNHFGVVPSKGIKMFSLTRFCWPEYSAKLPTY